MFKQFSEVLTSGVLEKKVLLKAAEIKEIAM